MATRSELYQRMFNGPIFPHPELFILYSWCLNMASDDRRCVTVPVGRGTTVQELFPGQFIFSRHSASQQLCVPAETVRTRMKTLEDAGLIEISPTPNFSIVSVCGYRSCGEAVACAVDDDTGNNADSPSIPQTAEGRFFCSLQAKPICSAIDELEELDLLVVKKKKELEEIQQLRRLIPEKVSEQIRQRSARVDAARYLYWFTDIPSDLIAKEFFGVHASELYIQLGPLGVPCGECGAVLTFSSRDDKRRSWRQSPSDPEGRPLCSDCAGVLSRYSERKLHSTPLPVESSIENRHVVNRSAGVVDVRRAARSLHVSSELRKLGAHLSEVSETINGHQSGEVVDENI